MNEQTQDKLIEIPPAIADAFMKKLAGYVALPDERAQYYLWDAINILIWDKDIQELLKTEFKDKYKDKLELYLNQHDDINEIKTLLDHTEEHTIKKNDLESPTWRRALHILRKSNIIHSTQHQILTIILTKTTISKWTIKTSDLQIYQREYKKFTDYNTRQSINTQNQPQIQPGGIGQ